MRLLAVLSIVLFASQVACAPVRPRVERLPITHNELHELETAARMAHPVNENTLTARDLHPATPILLAELDHSIPAFIVEREVAQTNLVETDDDSDMDVSQAQDQDQTQTVDAADDDDDDDAALIESDFEISEPYGYGGFGGYGGYGKKGGYGGYGGYGYGYGYGSKKVPFKKVPYKKVPYKKVPFKKAPPKKFPPKKAPPKKFSPKKFPYKKGGFGFGGYGYGGGHH